ncbi:MAG TPA: hypothetical protein VFN36_00345 [Solirubrobacteraceae bacterium]|nr:hypothetical protein [Solirubrobacteraceae bacterium]
MRTRAQVSRDDALRRLVTLNRSMVVAAVIGAGVLTDVVANTASGHVRTVATGSGGYQTALLAAGATAKHATTAHGTATTHPGAAAGASSSGGGSSAQSLSSSPAPAPAPAPAPVVVVSGGS